LECSELLIKNIDNLDRYRSQVLKKYAFYETAYNFLTPIFRGEISLLEQASISQAVFSHMMDNQERYGVSLQPQSLSVDPAALIQNAIRLAQMIRL